MADMEAIAASLNALLTTYGVTRDQIADLLGGPADGGPNGDGNYPVTLANGITRLVPSPARIALLTGNPETAVAALQPIFDATKTEATKAANAAASGLQAVVQAQAAAVQAAAQASAGAVTDYVGRPADPVTGDATLGANTRVVLTAVPTTGLLTIKLFSMLADGVSDTVIVRRMTKTGAATAFGTGSKTFTRVGADILMPITGGGSKTLATGVTVNAGEFLAFYFAKTGAVAQTTATGDGAGYMTPSTGAGNSTSFTGGTAVTIQQLQIQFAISYPYVTTAKIKSNEAAVGGLNLATSGVGGSVEATRLRLTAANVAVFTGMTLYLRDAAGKVARQYQGNGGIAGSFTFAESEQLRWVLDGTATGTVVKESTGVERSDPFIVLLQYVGARFQSGALMFQVERDQRENLLRFRDLLYRPVLNTSPYLNNNPFPIVRGNTVQFISGQFIASSPGGGASAIYAGPDGKGYNATFAFDDGDILVWDFTTAGNGEIKKLGPNDARPWKYSTLLRYFSGDFISGDLLPILSRAQAQLPGKVCTSENRVKIVPKQVSQAMTAVRDRIWHFKGPAVGSVAISPIWVSAADATANFPKLGELTHNFGHMGYADYDAVSDTMLVPLEGGKGLGALVNVSQRQFGDFLDQNDPNVIGWSINFIVRDGSGNIVKSLNGAFGGGGAGAAFGGASNIVWLAVDKRWFYRAELGMGAIDLSDKTAGGTDVTRWGAFLPGKSAQQHNGTLRILEGPFTARDTFRQYAQDLCYHAGRLIHCYTDWNPEYTTAAQRFVAHVDGTIHADKAWRYDNFGADGALVSIESEGICVVDGRYLVVASSNVGSDAGHFAVFPLDNEMGGRGAIGAGGSVTIAFPFAVNAAPQVALTATNAGGTQCFVSAVDPVAGTFTVTGPAGGRFNWSAPIS